MTRLPCQKVATTKIVDRQKDPLQMVPPYSGRDVIGGLPNRSRDLPQHRKTVIVVERLPVIASNAMRQQFGMVAVEQVAFVTAPMIGEQWSAIM